MDYLTNYYKNLSEELQTKINLLEMMIAQSAPPPPPPPAPAPSQPSPFSPQTPSPTFNPNNPAPGAPNQQGPVWDPDGDGQPNTPPGERPVRQPGEPPEEYNRRVFNWDQERKAYQEYLRQLREFNRQREKEREKKKRP